MCLNYSSNHSFSFIRTEVPIKELYQVNTTSVEAKGSSEEKRTLLQVRLRFQRNFPGNQRKLKFLSTQVAAAHDNKGAVRLLLEKGFVLILIQTLESLRQLSGSIPRKQVVMARRQWKLPLQTSPWKL